MIHKILDSRTTNLAIKCLYHRQFIWDKPLLHLMNPLFILHLINFMNQPSMVL